MIHVINKIFVLKSFQQKHCKNSNHVTIVDLIVFNFVIHHDFDFYSDLHYDLRFFNLNYFLNIE